MRFAGDEEAPLTTGEEGRTTDPSRYAVRNSRRYKIGEVSDIIGVSPESIRYYERLHLIKPEKNPISGYRYYSAWDINMLMKARSYRQQGFAINEVVEIMKDFNPTKTVEMLSEKEAELTREVAEKLKLVMQVRDDQALLRDAIGNCNEIKFEYRPAMHFLQTQTGYDMIASQRDMFGRWIQDYAAYVLPGGVYRGPDANDVAYGLFVEDSKLSDVSFKNEPELQALPSLLCLTTSFLSGSDVELKYALFQFAFDYIEEHGLEANGEPVSRIVMMARSGESAYRSLHKLWIPVSGAEELCPRGEQRFEELLENLLSL